MEAAQGRAPEGVRPLLRWLGLLLVGLVVSVWVSSMLFLWLGCSDDCGDKGGRGAFLLLTLLTPLAGLGTWLIVDSLAYDLQSGRRPGRLWRPCLKALRVALVMGMSVALLVALTLVALSGEAMLEALDAESRPDYSSAVILGVFACLWAGLGWLGWRAVGHIGALLRQWP